MSKVDEIVMQLHDKTSFLAGVQALKKNLTGPPSGIFGVAEAWPAFVTLSTYISPKMKDATLAATLEVLRIAEDLYPLSPEQRAAVARYKEAGAAAERARAAKQQQPQQQPSAVPAKPAAAKSATGSGSKGVLKLQPSSSSSSSRSNGGAPAPLVRPAEPRDRPPTVDVVGASDETQSREAELRAQRQAALFAQHDIAREEVRANLGHHPLRVLGASLSDTDAREVLFGSGELLRIGQLVAVPRSGGGLCYGEVAGATTGARCFFHPKVAHPDRLVRVRYGSQHKAVAPALLGRLPPVPSSEPVLEAERDGSAPSVGDFLSSGDAGTLQLGPGISFLRGELAAVPRSSGGFTIGRVLSPQACKCVTSPSHSVVAWRVQTDEPDDESEGKVKLVPCGLLGRVLAPWAAAMRSNLSKNAPPKSSKKPPAAGATATASSAPDDFDLNVEDKLRERFGDFTPFLDDDDELADRDGLGGALEDADEHQSESALGTIEVGAGEEDDGLSGALEEEMLEDDALELPTTWTSEPLFG